MKKLLWLCLLATASAASAQVKLNLSVGGKTAGTAVLTQRLNPDGSKAVELRIEMLAMGKKAKLTSQSTYDSKGNPVRKFLETIIPGQVQKQTVVTFDSAGANAVLLTGDGRQTKKVSLIESAPRAATSEFWFIRDVPKVGEKAKNYQFNADTLTWDLVENTYAGLKSVTVQGKQFKAHLVLSDQGTRHVASYLDDKGLPYVIDDGKLRMERILEK